MPMLSRASLRHRLLLGCLASLVGWSCSCGDTAEIATGVLEGVFRNGLPADTAQWTGRDLKVMALSPTEAEVRLVEGTADHRRIVVTGLRFQTDVPALQADSDDVCRHTPLSPMLYQWSSTAVDPSPPAAALPIGPGTTLLVQSSAIRLRWQNGDALVEVRWRRTDAWAHGS